MGGGRRARTGDGTGRRHLAGPSAAIESRVCTICRKKASRSYHAEPPVTTKESESTMPLKILILGVNGFIGNSLTEHILNNRDWEVYGMDMSADKLDQCLGRDRFHFVEGDITINREWIEYHV